MNNKVACGLSFVAGAVIASAATWVVAKKKYEDIIQVEVDSARETYSRMAKELADKNAAKKEDISRKQAPSKAQKVQVTKASNYVSYNDIPEPVVGPEDEEEPEDDSDDQINFEEIPLPFNSGANKPYTIAPDNFGNEDGYGLYTLHFYQGDHVLTDEDDEPIDNVDSLVGKASLDTFGEYDDYTVYVRNDDKRADYEILLDERSYAESHS